MPAAGKEQGRDAHRVKASNRDRARQSRVVRDSGRKALVPADRKAGACAVAAAATWPICSNVCPRSRSMILKWAIRS